MMRFINAALAVLVLGTAVWTYSIKYETEKQLAEIRSLKAQIETERETIELLTADWAFLTQPERLQKLAARYQESLKLDVTTATQIVNSSELPGEPIRDASDGIAEILAGEGLDNLTTGSTGGGN